MDRNSLINYILNNSTTFTSADLECFDDRALVLIKVSLEIEVNARLKDEKIKFGDTKSM